ncbi:MAG: 50S ribosomal protein L30 [Proteobacteria bacterium]|nr:50S ribosomal protein L30 [Pseudomonadota bacterium]
MQKLKITRTRSSIGSGDGQIATLKHLGLRKLNSTVVVEDTPVTRGMIKKVEHMVKVEPVVE